jgi:hypothetical protein
MSKRGTQRTRGNLKVKIIIFIEIYVFHFLSLFQPSSSAKASAVILTHGISPFALFSGKFLPIRIRKKLAYSIRIGELPISNGMDESGIDNDIDSDLRVILRKLTKKDSTTKIRVKKKQIDLSRKK